MKKGIFIVIIIILVVVELMTLGMLNESKNEFDAQQAKIEKLNSKIEEQEKVIEGLNSQVKQLSDVSREQAEKIKKLREELVVANANLEYYKELPWFKRIFFKG
jgi:cell division protein FtsL